MEEISPAFMKCFSQQLWKKEVLFTIADSGSHGLIRGMDLKAYGLGTSVCGSMLRMGACEILL